MVITLVLAAACAFLAARRGGSWWKWGLGAAGIDIGMTLLLLVAFSRLGINVHRPEGGGAAIAGAWILLIVPRVAAVAVVYSATRGNARSSSVGPAPRKRGPTSARAPRAKGKGAP
jgi:hypothetical protein